MFMKKEVCYSGVCENGFDNDCNYDHNYYYDHYYFSNHYYRVYFRRDYERGFLHRDND